MQYLVTAQVISDAALFMRYKPIFHQKAAAPSAVASAALEADLAFQAFGKRSLMRAVYLQGWRGQADLTSIHCAAPEKVPACLLQMRLEKPCLCAHLGEGLKLAFSRPLCFLFLSFFLCSLGGREQAVNHCPGVCVQPRVHH